MRDVGFVFIVDRGGTDIAGLEKQLAIVSDTAQLQMGLLQYLIHRVLTPSFDPLRLLDLLC